MKWLGQPAPQRVEPPPHHFVIIHRTSGPRTSTREFADQLIAEIGNEARWERDECDFGQLASAEIYRAATLAASRAALVIIAIDDRAEFSTSFHAWMKEWPRHVFNPSPVLIALAPPRRTEATRTNRLFLENIAETTGLTYLYNVDRTLIEYHPETGDSLPHTAAPPCLLSSQIDSAAR